MPIDKDSKEARNKRIFDLWMSCYTQEEIAEMENLNPTDKSLRISGNLEELPNNQKSSANHQTDFGKWIEAEFEMSKFSATRIMWVAEKFEGKFNNMLNLKPTILYQLAAPSTPDEVTEKAIDKAENGEKVN